MLENAKKTIIPFFMAGYPDMSSCELLISDMIEEGVEIIEVGVPFSDPVADGPSVQRASAKALINGTHLEDVLDLIARLKKKYPQVSIVLFTYLNPLLKFGLQKYVQEALKAGVSATLTVDLPPEEAEQYLSLHRQSGLKTVFLVSPTTRPERMALISEVSSGFIYYISRTGVTGVQSELSSSLAEEIQVLRKISDRPVAVGFGISSPEQVLAVSQMADAVVVGSHLLNLVERNSSQLRAREEVRSFIRTSLNQMGGEKVP